MNQSSVLDFMLLSFGCDFDFRDEEWVGGNGEKVVGRRVRSWRRRDRRRSRRRREEIG